MASLLKNSYDIGPGPLLGKLGALDAGLEVIGKVLEILVPHPLKKLDWDARWPPSCCFLMRRVPPSAHGG
eukprot:15211572-Alexandrium_andersonii.AAC.1